MTDELKNVVVVGAAASGLQTAQTIAKTLPSTHRIVLIEANPVAFWSIGALRGAVQPGWESKLVHELSTETIFGSGSRHVVLAGTRVVDIAPDHVVVSRDVTTELPGSSAVADSKTRIGVDRVVLGLGAEYGFPARVATTAQNAADVEADFVKMQREIERAQNILVVGGGPTGVEFVGEVLDVHPKKNITLLTRGPALASTGNDSLAGMGKKLLSQLEARGAHVLLDDSIPSDLTTGPIASQTFTTTKGVELTADYVLVASGGRPNTAWLQSLHPHLIDDKGLIKVTDTFTLDAPGWERYYSLGDAANTPGPKTMYLASQHAPLVAHNVLASISGAPASKLKKVPAPGSSVMVVPIGKSGGAGYVGFFTAGSWITSTIKGKSLFLSNFNAWFKA